MLARLYVALPFSLTLPIGSDFALFEYEDEGYHIRMCTPVKSDQPSHLSAGDQILVDDQPGFEADALQIEFRRDSFDRRSSVECDPPYDLIRKTVNTFLVKLRFVTRGFQVRPIDFPHSTWRLEYLKDDGTPVEAGEGLVKGRGTLALQFSWIAITPRIWKEIHELDVMYAPPEWDGLGLDAKAALPDVGPAIVLAQTALEVFIGHVLDALAAKKVSPPQLWFWINNREWLREPSVEEQFDQLLKTLLGASLKQNSTLWEAFKNLKSARNSFVHGGVAQVGKKTVTEAEARQLVEDSAKIISFIRGQLPLELQWPEYVHKMQVRFEKKIPVN